MSNYMINSLLKKAEDVKYNNKQNFNINSFIYDIKKFNNDRYITYINDTLLSDRKTEEFHNFRFVCNEDNNLNKDSYVVTTLTYIGRSRNIELEIINPIISYNECNKDFDIGINLYTYYYDMSDDSKATDTLLFMLIKAKKFLYEKCNRFDDTYTKIFDFNIVRLANSILEEDDSSNILKKTSKITNYLRDNYQIDIDFGDVYTYYSYLSTVNIQDKYNT